MLRITHPQPELGRQQVFGVDFIDGVAEVNSLHPERELALTQHGFSIVHELEGIPLEDLTVAELREIADQEGIDVPRKAKKAELIAAIDTAPHLPVLTEE